MLGLTGDVAEDTVLQRLAALEGQATTTRAAHDQLLAQLRTILTLPPDASEGTILTRLRSDAGERSALAETVGLQAISDGSAVLLAVRTACDPTRVVPFETVVALQAELNETRAGIARERAERTVDEAIRAGKVPQPSKMREHYVTRHMADPRGVELELGAMISLHGSRLTSRLPPPIGHHPHGLDDAEADVVSMMGLDPVQFAKTKAEHAAREESRGSGPEFNS